jgi:hypothetical protein
MAPKQNPLFSKRIFLSTRGACNLDAMRTVSRKSQTSNYPLKLADFAEPCFE